MLGATRHQGGPGAKSPNRLLRKRTDRPLRVMPKTHNQLNSRAKGKCGGYRREWR